MHEKCLNFERDTSKEATLPKAFIFGKNWFYSSPKKGKSYLKSFKRKTYELVRSAFALRLFSLLVKPQ